MEHVGSNKCPTQDTTVELSSITILFRERHTALLTMDILTHCIAVVKSEKYPYCKHLGRKKSASNAKQLCLVWDFHVYSFALGSFSSWRLQHFCLASPACQEVIHILFSLALHGLSNMKLFCGADYKCPNYFKPFIPLQIMDKVIAVLIYI